jgi:threonine dehydratase
MEILRQHSGSIHAIFVAVGGGGLIAGVAAYVKQIRPDIKIIGVQTTDSNAMEQSLKAGRRITLPEVGLFSDGTAVKLVGQETFRLSKEYVDEIILVNTDEVCAAIKDVFQDTRSILEPAGALSIAGAKAYIERAKANKKPIKLEVLKIVAQKILSSLKCWRLLQKIPSSLKCWKLLPTKNPIKFEALQTVTNKKSHHV